jgi:hypothetical protein
MVELYQAVNPTLPASEYATKAESLKLFPNPRMSAFAPVTEHSPGKLLIYLPYALAYIVKYTALEPRKASEPRLKITDWPTLVKRYLSAKAPEINHATTPNLLLLQLEQQVKLLTTKVKQLELRVFEGGSV